LKQFDGHVQLFDQFDAIFRAHILLCLIFRIVIKGAIKGLIVTNQLRDGLGGCVNQARQFWLYGPKPGL